MKRGVFFILPAETKQYVTYQYLHHEFFFRHLEHTLLTVTVLESGGE